MNPVMATMRRIHTGLLAFAVLLAGIGQAGAGSSAPPPPAPPPAPAAPSAPPTPAAPGPQPAPADSNAEETAEATPPRISYLHGEVSLWRPGAPDWTAAVLNMPLAPGDVLYAGPAGNVEIQVGPRAFVRAAYGAQIGFDNQEPDFLQLRVTSGYAAVDLRELPPGHAVELDTPGAAFTMERPGYYHVEVGADATTFRTHRGGAATMTPSGGTATAVAANQQVVVSGGETPHVETGTAAALSAWDRWNYQRSDYLTQPASAKYVSGGVYGGEALDQHGSWRTVETYGSVWVPAGVPPGWSPYTTGRWIWDPRFGWTWLDEAPWGWAPYHYGRWVFVGPYWAWAPGPVVVRPVYAPALVVFLGGPVVVGRPLYWAPLGWGEPVIRWWGGPRFVGVAWWGGWGGPRVVNNVVIHRTTTVNVTNITVYRNVNVTNAVVGVPADRFGHPGARPVRLADASEVRRLAPVRGAPDVRPAAASLVAGAGPAAARPPEAVRSRAVVATRAPRDPAPALRAEGLSATSAAAPQPQHRIVPAPARTVTPPAAPGGAASRAPGGAGRATPEEGPRRDRGRSGAGRAPGQPAPPGGAAREATPSRQAVPPAPPAPGVQSAPPASPGVEGRGEPKGRRPAERPGRVEGPGRGNPERGAGERGGERGAGDKGGPRGDRDR
jgi:uncharacterized protein DUF6600